MRVSAWLLPRLSPEPALTPGPWYESLYLERSRAEDTAFEALRWLLSVLPTRALVVQAEDMFDDVTVAVPGSAPLAVAVADRAAALFMLTGAFTQAPAEGLLGTAKDLLLRCTIPTPANVLTPVQEAKSRFGLVTKGGYAWCWAQTADNPAVVAGAY